MYVCTCACMNTRVCMYVYTHIIYIKHFKVTIMHKDHTLSYKSLI